MEDAFAVFENVCSKSVEWSVPMLCARLDLRKDLDRIDYNALFDALRVQGVPHAYLKRIAHCILIKLDWCKENNLQSIAV